MKLVFLAKIHKSEFILDMYEKEYLYFSVLKGFRGAKDELGRFDPRELNVKNKQIATLAIKIEDKTYELDKMLDEFSCQLMANLEEPNINCCSLHWLEIESGKPPSTINNELLRMGDKVLLIADGVSFFKILDQSLEKYGLTYKRGRVKYYDPSIYNGELTLHQKDIKFRFQNEYRILINSPNNEPAKIYLPGLKQISYIIDSKDLSELRIEIK